jgi:prepilin-type N-terminal cleavage/methylation domain-containing protein
MVKRWNRGRPGAEEGSDTGVTLVELLVAMSIFTVLMSIFMVSIARMTHQTVRVQNVGDATASMQRAFERLDRQVRYANAINRSAVSGGNYYLEFRTDALARRAAADRCDQYRVNVAAGTLEWRSWDVPIPPSTTTPTPTGWATMATRVVLRTNAAVVIPPFEMFPTSSDSSRQRVIIRLDVKAPDSPVVQTDSTLVARNSTSSTSTNINSPTGDVCRQIGRP